MAHRLIYMTTETEADAERIGQALVSERLAACINIVAGMRSMYWWDGVVQQSVSLAIDGGNPAFLDWIDAETA